MLRIRDSKWGYWLFDLWVLSFSALVLYGVIHGIDTANHANKISKQTKAIALANKRLAHRNRQLIKLVHKNSQHNDFEICLRLNNINVLITATLNRSKINIPKIAYFKDHPDELRAQVKEVNRELRLFKPRACLEGR